jgi:pimeloyl-ACP methyl ester carboxylesterase
MAIWVRNIFDAYQALHQVNFENYSIVGHSVGAKIALVVACHSDIFRVSTVISLDPIDMNPAEFTSGNIKLADATASLYIAWACAGGAGISARNNPKAIYETNPASLTSFVQYQNAGHMAFTDNGGGLPGMLMRSGSKEGNKRAHAETLQLVETLRLL